MHYAIGIDIGGTQLRLGVVDSQGKLVATYDSSSFSKEDPQALIEAIVAALGHPDIKPYFDQKKIAGIGIGMAGLVDTEKGLVYASPHFPHINRFAMRDALLRTLPHPLKELPIVIDNDANFLALGELSPANHNSAQTWSDFILVAVGTGIGGGIIRNGKIDHGTTGFAGEIGHFCLNPDGPACPCGSRGCWEAVASGSGLANLIREQDPAHDLLRCHDALLGYDLFDRAKAGDAFALSIYQRLGRNLAIGIASLINITGIHRYVLAGGFYEAKDFFFPTLLSELPRWTYTLAYPPAVEMEWSTLAPWGGVYGAAYQVLMHP